MASMWNKNQPNPQETSHQKMKNRRKQGEPGLRGSRDRRSRKEVQPIPREEKEGQSGRISQGKAFEDDQSTRNFRRVVLRA